MVAKSEISIAIVAATLMLGGCDVQDETKGIARHTTSSCSDTKLDERFFLGVFVTSEQHPDGDVTGIAEFLQRIGEPPISCDIHADETYRLTYLPERDDALVLRAQRRNDHYELVVVGGGTKSTNQLLDQADWNKLTAAIERYNFWSRSPYPSPSIHNDRIVLHGPAWLLEGQETNWYHAVSRPSSFKEAEFDLPARAFIEIAKLEDSPR